VSAARGEPGRAGTVPLAALRARLGQELGVSDWIRVDQARITGFADVTGDHQFIHVDPVRAADTPFGTTIAHGYLTLSLLPAMAYDVIPAVEGARLGVNYGLDKVRFIAPVKSGERVRGRFSLASFDERSPGVWKSVFDVEVDIEGGDRPALAAQWTTLAIF